MKRSFLEKLAERYRELEIARRVYLELGGDEEEPHRMEVHRTMSLSAGEPTLKITRRVDGEVPAQTQAKPRGRPRKKPKLNGDGAASHAAKYGVMPRGGRQKHALEILSAFPGGLTSRGFIDKWKYEKGKDNQGVYQALHELKKRGVLKHDGMSGLYTLARSP